MPDPVEIAEEVVGNLIPPEVKKLSKETKWKIWISLGVVVSSGALTLHILLACGFIPSYPGFAKAGETDKLKQEMTMQMATMESRVMGRQDALAEVVKSTRLNTLRKDLLDVKQKQCKASGVVRALMVEQIQNMQLEYKSLSGEQYPLPGCDSF